jgi:exopolyphosphatase / guanosine-5'-triphosphate,3'-diphosphate pyrophosphatase
MLRLAASVGRRIEVKSRLWKPPVIPVAKVRVAVVLPQTKAVQQPSVSESYAALDLGTNNCRLLIARPSPSGFRIVDSFSRIVRLGEGLAATGRISEAAITRTIETLKICAARLNEQKVRKRRLIATEACRAAANGEEFLERVYRETGLRLEIIERQIEAELAAAGCAVLMARAADSVILFDIGGGSTEVVWLASSRYGTSIGQRIRQWTSVPMGVVTLAERHGGHDVSEKLYNDMVAEVLSSLRPFIDSIDKKRFGKDFHLLGTSGTVTTVGALHLNLERYDRKQIDGLWMTTRDADVVISKLRNQNYKERAANPCIGTERADLVLAGCAIYDAVARAFPSEKIRIADRGLREGILIQLMQQDNVWHDKRGPAIRHAMTSSTKSAQAEQ